MEQTIASDEGRGQHPQVAARTGKDLINAHISDPVLRGVLSGQSGDHGLPPSQVSAFFHAGITYHYLNGGYYPRGGGFAIPRAFVRALKRAGGEIRLSTTVDRILLEHGKAIGVRLATGAEIRSRYVISNADPGMTFGKLIGREHLSTRLRRKVDGVKYSGSALSLFFAVDMDLRRAAGLDSGNNWFYDRADVDGVYRLGLTDYALKAAAPPGMCSLRLDTRWGDVIPAIASGSTISMKNCADTTIVLCGMFK